MNRSNDNMMKREKESLPHTTRLIFSYEGNTIKLIATQFIQMVPPPSDTLEAKKEASGFWYEITDATNRILFRRIIQNPIKHYVEVRSDNPDRPFMWQKSVKPSGTFVLLAPAFDEAANISLFSSPPGLEIREPATEIARFALMKNEKGKEK